MKQSRMWWLCAATLLLGSTLYWCVFLSRPKSYLPAESSAQQTNSGTDKVVLESSEGPQRKMATVNASKLVVVRVLSTFDDGPIEDARVSTITESDESNKTDARGEVTLAYADVAGRDLIVTGTGYFTNGVRWSDLQTVIERADPVVIRLRRSGSLVVQVEGPGQDPVPLVHVNVKPYSSSKQQLDYGEFYHWPVFAGPFGYSPELQSQRYVLSWTDPSGRKLLDGLPCDQPMLVEIDGVVPRASEIVTIPSSTRTAVVQFSATQSSTVRGELKWEDGSYASNITVWSLIDPSSNGTLNKGVSDYNGQFVLRGIRRGRSVLSIDVPGTELVPCNADAAEIDLGTIILPQRHLVQGRLSTKGSTLGIRLDRTRIRVTQHGRVVVEKSLARDGGFSLGLSEGTYELNLVEPYALTKPLQLSVPSGFVDVDADAMFGTVFIRGTQPSNQTTIRLVPTNGESVGARKYIEYQIAPAGFVVSAPDGCAMWLVPAGQFEVAKQLQSGGAWLALGGVTVQPGIQSVIDEGDRTAMGNITGHVLDVEGRGVARVPITANYLAFDSLDRGLLRLAATTDGEGAFSFDGLVTGEWAVYPSSLGPRSEGAVTVAVRAGTSEEVVLRSGGTGVVDIIVKCGGDLATDASVRLRQVEERYTMSAGVDGKPMPGGRFEFVDIAPGRYLALVNKKQGGCSCHLGTVIQVVSGMNDDVVIQCECSPVPLFCEWMGQPVDDIYAAEAYGALGFSTLKTSKTTSAMIQACLSPGRWLIRVDRSQHLAAPQPPRATGIALGILDVPAEIPATGLRLRLGEGIVRVTLKSGADGVQLPLCCPSESDGIALRYGPGVSISFGYKDTAPGVREFLYVPRSTKMVLRGRVGSEVVVKAIEMSEETTLQLEWPPR